MKILEVRIKSNNITAQAEFYGNLLGLPVEYISKSKVHIQIGNSTLILEESEDFNPYHFAINTPSHSEHEMLSFVKARTKVLPYEGNEIALFDNWNARSVYFYDADHNIVELISRNNLKIPKEVNFDAKSFLEISEIGLPTKDLKSIFKTLNDTCKLEIYSGDLERFCAIGDEHGLFICINTNHKTTWIPMDDKAYLSDFKLLFEQLGKRFTLQVSNGKIQNGRN